MIKVSIVEDHPKMLKALIKIIGTDSDLLCISTHTTLEEAQEQILQYTPDIVLLDLNLKGKNGIELIHQVRETNSIIQFLICTVWEDDDHIFEALEAGALGYVLKKSEGEIIKSIKELYNGGSPMSPEIARRVILHFSSKTNFLEKLSSREMEILDFISKKDTYKDVAKRLNLSTATIRNHLHNIYRKLHVKGKTEAVKQFMEKRD